MRLRVELADRPGSLAEVAGIIAAHGGNITALDVHSGTDAVIDEITVDFGDDIDLAAVRRALVLSGSARVLSHQAATPVDQVTRVLRRMVGLADLVDKSTAAWDEALRRMTAEMCATPAVWIYAADDAARYEAGARAVERPGEAIVSRTQDRLPPLGETIDGEAWLLGIATTTAAGGRVLLVARPIAQGFTLTEVGRIEALVAVQERIALLRPSVPA